MMEKRLNENIIKFIHNAVGVFILFQNIYFYDEKYSWTIIPVYLILTVIIDFKKTEVRSFQRELTAILSFFAFSLSIVLFKIFDFQLLFLTSSFFVIGATSSVIEIILTFRMFLKNDLSDFINEKNSKLIERQTSFIPVYLICVGIGLVFTIGRVLILV